jgi:serine/threonine protein kinase HipA of HipAB toxin-antitoxin module
VRQIIDKILQLDDVRDSQKSLTDRVESLEKKVVDLEKMNEDMARSIAALAIIQANLLKELQNMFSKTKKQSIPVFTQRKTDDYMN